MAYNEVELKLKSLDNKPEMKEEFKNIRNLNNKLENNIVEILSEKSKILR